MTQVVLLLLLLLVLLFWSVVLCMSPGWNMTTTPSMQVGSTVCSATQTVVPWSVLPARVTYMNEGTAKFEGGTGVC